MFNFKLRKIIDDNDMFQLFTMMSENDQYMFSTHLLFNTYFEFYNWLSNHINNGFKEFYVISDKDNEQKIIGFVYNYEFSLESGHCKLCVYVAPQFRNSGLGGIIAIKFLDILFRKYPLRKIYSTIYEYNLQSLESNFKAGFLIEGTVNKYRYYNGEYHDLHYLSISREKFKETLQKLVSC